MVRTVSRISVAPPKQTAFDHYRQFLENIPSMAINARAAALNEAYSYRNFKVGNALYAVDLEVDEYAIIVTGSLKRKQDKKKFCSEMRGTTRAVKAELTHAIGFVTVGTTDPDKIEEVNGFRTATLTPCHPCVDFIDESPLIVPDHTPMVTVGLENDRFQANPLRAIKAMYSPESIADGHAPDWPVRYGFENWQSRVAVYDSYVANATDLSDARRAGFVLVALSVGSSPPYAFNKP